MPNIVIFAIVWLSALQAGHHVVAAGAAESPLVSDAVTVEGTAAIEVTADAARLAFTISATSGTAADALASLKPARDEFKKAVAAVGGLKSEVEFDVPYVARREEKDAATAHVVYLPKDKRDLDDFLSKLTASVLDSGTTAPGAAGPVVVFEVSSPKVAEEDLLAEAVKDASARAAVVSKALKRKLGEVRSAHFANAVTVDGGTVSLGGEGIIESRTPAVTIEYTVRVAYALER
jgi:uncharacterized protein YggE